MRVVLFPESGIAHPVPGARDQARQHRATRQARSQDDYVLLHKVVRLEISERYVAGLGRGFWTITFQARFRTNSLAALENAGPKQPGPI